MHLGRPSPRWVPSVVLFVSGGISALLVALTHDITWRAIWIGAAATCLSAGLVDASAVWERQRQLQPVRRLAARRVGSINSLTFAMVNLVFEGFRTQEADPYIASLRAFPDGPLDLSKAAQVIPPRSKAQHAAELVRELRRVQADCLSFAGAGVLAADLEQLDRILTSSVFLSFVEAAQVGPLQRTSRVLSEAAADLLTEMRPIVLRARWAAGASWKYGMPNY